jgi:hypothetical protein
MSFDRNPNQICSNEFWQLAILCVTIVKIGAYFEWGLFTSAKLLLSD